MLKYRAEFEEWLQKECKLTRRKLVTDNSSRAEKVESLLCEQYGEGFSLYKQFKNGKAEEVLRLFSTKGRNEYAEKLKPGLLPVGQMAMYPLKSAVNRYFVFLQSFEGQDNNG